MLFEGQLYCDMMATVSPGTPTTIQLQCFLMMITFESYSLTNLQADDTVLTAAAATHSSHPQDSFINGRLDPSISSKWFSSVCALHRVGLFVKWLGAQDSTWAIDGSLFPSGLLYIPFSFTIVKTEMQVMAGTQLMTSCTTTQAQGTLHWQLCSLYIASMFH